jgi:integrase/recombinase XerD
MEVLMLTTLFPRAFHKHSTLPLLGSIADKFDDWLLDRGYKVNSRIYAIEMLRHIDKDLRRRGIKRVTSLTHSVLHSSWCALIRRFPHEAGTVRALEQYLKAHGMLNCADRAEPCSGIDSQTTAYAVYLREIRGVAESTIRNHVRTAKYFLTHLGRKSRRLQALTSDDLEEYIKKAGKRRGRAGLRNEVAALRGFLRFLATSGKIPPGWDSRIDTPRVYRLEQLPRSLPWETVRAFLRSIDRTTDRGLRDYTIFLLIATYGLRVSEIVALTLENIQWRTNCISIPQRKRVAPLELPLTNEVGTVLLKYLKRVPPRAPHRELFLRMRAPVGPLQPVSVSSAFRKWSRLSCLNIPLQGAHCLRHSYAVNLLRNGTPLKTIGDILGHRCAESTIAYLRLGIDDLRNVALPAPRKLALKGVQR